MRILTIQLRVGGGLSWRNTVLWKLMWLQNSLHALSKLHWCSSATSQSYCLPRTWWVFTILSNEFYFGFLMFFQNLLFQSFNETIFEKLQSLLRSIWRFEIELHPLSSLTLFFLRMFQSWKLCFELSNFISEESYLSKKSLYNFYSNKSIISWIHALGYYLRILSICRFI